MFHFLRSNIFTRKAGPKLPSIDYRQLNFDLNGHYLHLQKEHSKQVQLHEGKKRKLNIVCFTGAGISVSSGLPAFDSAVGTNEPLYACFSDRQLQEDAVNSVEQFNQYIDSCNLLWSRINKSEPSLAHKAIALLDERHDTTVITQCVDDLHEKAGSKNIFHVHGSVLAKRYVSQPRIRQIWDKPLSYIKNIEEVSSAFIPDVVRFSECCHNLVVSAEKIAQADIILVVGCRLAIHPAASLLQYAPPDSSIFYINKIAQPNVIVNGYIMEGDADDLCPKLVQTIQDQL